jgi:hypothetical protein
LRKTMWRWCWICTHTPGNLGLSSTPILHLLRPIVSRFCLWWFAKMMTGLISSLTAIMGAMTKLQEKFFMICLKSLTFTRFRARFLGTRRKETLKSHTTSLMITERWVIQFWKPLCSSPKRKH